MAFFTYWKRFLVGIVLLGLLAAGCSGAPPLAEQAPAPTAGSASLAEEENGPPPTGVPTEPETGATVPAETPAAPDPGPTAESLAAPEPDSTAVALALPLPLTPSQGEGPYYPVALPDDRDSDLVHVAGAAGAPAGETLQLSGRVLLQDGTPLEGAVVEIWQTDGGGVYLHPNDPNFAARDPNFQSFGQSLTDDGGNYSFLTLYPQLYGSRPRHIHVKVKFEGRELLTTQFYFAGDERLQSDGLVAQAGDEINRLLVDMSAGSDAAGAPLLKGTLDIVLAGE